MKKDDELIIHILRCVSEMESKNKIAATRLICPCLHDEQSGSCIRFDNYTWQDIDYTLKLLKYKGLIQSDNRKDPVIGVSFTCLSATGRKLLESADPFF